MKNQICNIRFKRPIFQLSINIYVMPSIDGKKWPLKRTKKILWQFNPSHRFQCNIHECLQDGFVSKTNGLYKLFIYTVKEFWGGYSPIKGFWVILRTLITATALPWQTILRRYQNSWHHLHSTKWTAYPKLHFQSWFISFI